MIFPPLENKSVSTPLSSTGSVQFIAGNIANYLRTWKQLTTDEVFLKIVSGYELKFNETPVQMHLPKGTVFGNEELKNIDNEIKKLLNKGVIVTTKSCPGEFISNIFARPEKDGSHRLILNLKNLNKHIVYHHFKMETLQNVPHLIKPNSWLAVIDAYYSVPVCKQHRKYLRFQNNGNLYEFVGLPNGLSSAPRVFTKLLKPVFRKLRGEGILLI